MIGKEDPYCVAVMSGIFAVPACCGALVALGYADVLDVERRQQIIGFVERHNGATVAELGERFGVSHATVRRDLALLSRRGLIERAHGGAAPILLGSAQRFPEPPILKRAALQAEEKRRIGRAASKYVRDGDVAIISGGTTTAQMIPHLVDRQELTVITNALNIASLLAPYPNITVIILGGALRHLELSMLGALTEDALKNLRADKLFMGTPAINVDYGLSADDMTEVQSDRTIMASAREVTVLADHSKFGKIATVRQASIERIHRVVTDSEVGPAHVAALREKGVEVEVASLD
jgi:DeoR/GlpR family transcriptional regulator of sugar metabolism